VSISETESLAHLFLLPTLCFPGEKGPGNLEFDREVSKAWSRFVPTSNRTRALPSDSSPRLRVFVIVYQITSCLYFQSSLHAVLIDLILQVG
jgi:hypothetical protein